MISNPNLIMITSYMKWANDIFYNSVSKLPESELTKDRPMLFGNIINLLNHVYAMEVVWKSYLEGSSHNFQSRCPDERPSFSELWEKQTEIDEWYINYASSLPSDKCDEIINFTFIGGGAGSMSHHEIIHHVVNHASYHRGHIEGVFYQLSVEPPTTDLPVFLRDDYKNVAL